MEKAKNDVLEALAHLEGKAEVDGYAALQVDDGEFIVFKRSFLERLVADMLAKGQDKATVFVKHSGKMLDATIVRG